MTSYRYLTYKWPLTLYFVILGRTSKKPSCGMVILRSNFSSLPFPNISNLKSVFSKSKVQGGHFLMGGILAGNERASQRVSEGNIMSHKRKYLINPSFQLSPDWSHHRSFAERGNYVLIINSLSQDNHKYCQRYNGLKAVSILTHSSPSLQSRRFNKLWNLA